MTTVTEYIIKRRLAKKQILSKFTDQKVEPSHIAICFIEGKPHLLKDGMVLHDEDNIFYEPPFSLEQVFTYVNQWQTQFDGKATASGLINHLREEVNEFSEDKSPEELADIFIILFHLCALLDIEPALSVYNKLEKNKKRTWQEPDAEGKIKHADQ